MNTVLEMTATARGLYEAKRAPEAMALMEALLQDDPLNESHMIQLALYLRAVGRFDESLAYVDRVSPDMNGYPMLKGWHLLRQGKFLEGMRMRERELGINRIERLFPFPESKRYQKGISLNGSRILLALEGGNGDEIAYLRFIPLLEARGATVTVAVSAENFVSIAERASGNAEVLPIAAVSHDLYDYYLPSMSIIDLLDIDDPSRNISIPYITPDATRVSAWRPILDAAAGGRPKIGIQWQGNPEFDHIEFKTLPASLLAEFGTLGKLFKIQRPESLTPDNMLPPSTDAFDTQTGKPDWEETLAVVSEMDYIVAGDTTITHMAGALGKQTLVLLPHAPHPYWADLKETSTWYRSVRVFRQSSYNDWQSAATHALEHLMAHL